MLKLCKNVLLFCLLPDTCSAPIIVIFVLQANLIWMVVFLFSSWSFQKTIPKFPGTSVCPGQKSQVQLLSFLGYSGEPWQPYFAQNKMFYLRWDGFFVPLKYQLFQGEVHSCKICITLQLWWKWNINWFMMNSSCFHCLQFAFGRGAIISPPRDSNYIFKLKYVLLLHLNIAHQKQKVCILWSCRAIICHCTLYFSS